MNVMREAHRYAKMNRISHSSYREALRRGLKEAHATNKKILANIRETGEFIKDNERLDHTNAELQYPIKLNVWSYGKRTIWVIEDVEDLDDDLNSKTLWTGFDRHDAIEFFNANLKKGRK